MLNSPKKRKFILLVAMALGGFLLFFLCRPMNIIAVHQMKYYTIILVKNYPITDIGKMEWWIKNKNEVQAKYNILRPEKDGSYNVILWDFGEGYKEEGKYDRLCFDDMNSPKNCVDKKSLVIISYNKDKETKFTVDDGIYVLQENGLIVKRK